jgi:hypothetical protein
MTKNKMEFLLNTLEKTIDDVSSGEDATKEAGLAAIGIARDLLAGKKETFIDEG